jgi:hypothetical protein
MLLHRVIAIAVSLGLLQCSSRGGESSIGTHCTPGSETNHQFAGFKVVEETIVTGAPECGGGVCLVNHFQGRVSCPLGQAPPQPCSGPADLSCEPGSTCVQAGTLAPGCDPSAPDKGSSACAGYGGVCNAATGSCMCNQTADCPGSMYCDGETKQCTTYVCHKGDCQVPGAGNFSNEDKACCIPGTDTPVAVPVCGQCSPQSNRDADRAVYCSCRCGVAEGQPEDPDFDFCECAAGFECVQVRPYLGIGDPKLAGKYCIRQGTEFKSEQSCGLVRGFFNSQQCEGLAASGN